jgi:hypothetical protein
MGKIPMQEKSQHRDKKIKPDKLFGFLVSIKKPPLEFAGALFTKVDDLAMSSWTVGALLLQQKPRYPYRGRYLPAFFCRAICG